MTATNFKIIKQCINCGQSFESQKITTKYCTHKCNQRHYKLKKRLEKVTKVETQTLQNSQSKLKVKSIDLIQLRNKEFLSVSEVSVLLSCNKKTVYRMIQNGTITACNLGERVTRIRREHLESCFKAVDKVKTNSVLNIDNCYSIKEILKKYNVSDNGLRAMTKKNIIPKIRINKYTYYSKEGIDNMFSI